MGERELPTGVVTFLLTDVVGSTRLWEADSTAMAAALDQHDRIIGSAVAECAGVLLKARGEGDSTFSVFRRATDALTAAARVRGDLHGDGVTLVVRMAIHTGEAVERDGDYFGPTVNRVARLRAVTAPDEILLSQSSATLAGDRAPGGSRLVDLGVLELRDLARPERVFALVAPGMTDPPPGSLRGRPSVRPGDVVVTAPLPLPARLAALPETGFAGRAAERDRILLRAKESEEGDIRVVLVGAAPGMGKTRLAAEVCREALARGSLILYGRCDPEIGLPYQPFIEALRHYVAAVGDEFLPRHGARRMAELARLIPDLSTAPEPRSPAGDPEAERYLLFGAVASVLREITERAPVILVLDDLHWADKPSLLLLRHLLVTPMRLLVIGTYWDTDLEPGGPLEQTIALLRREAGVDRVSLAGLDVHETLTLMEAAAGHALGERAMPLAQLLHRETGGNPFFCSEILRHLAEVGSIRQREDGAWVASVPIGEVSLPESVREVVTQRVRRLGRDALRVLGLAAVIGREFDIDLVAEVSGADDEAVLEIAERAVAASLLVETDGRAGRFGFEHAIVQHTLYDELGAARRRRAHQRIAEALESMPGPLAARASEIAHHWFRAALPTDSAKAVAYAQLAAEQSLLRLAPDEAIRWYGQALELIDARMAEQEVPALLRLDLLIGLGDAQRQAGDAAYRRTLLDAAHAARLLGDADGLVRATLTNNRGFNSGSGTVDDERVEALREALDAAGPDDRMARALILATLATELTWDGDPRPRLELARESVAVARRLDDPETLVRVINMCHNALWLPELLDERDRLTAEAVGIADEVRDPVAQFWASSYRQTVALERGEIALVDRCLARGRSIAEDIGQPTLRWLSGVARSWRVLLGGDPDEAEAVAGEALALGAETGQPDTFTAYGSHLLEVRRAQGRIEELLPLVRRLAADHPGLPAYEAALARIHADLGELDEARALVAANATAGFPLPYDIAWSSGMAMWAEAIAAVGDAEAAGQLYPRLAPWARVVAFNGASVQGSIAHSLGLLASALGREAEAGEHFALALDVHRGLASPWFVAATELAWARSLIASADPPRALDLIDSAARAADVYGFPLLAAQAAEARRHAERERD